MKLHIGAIESGQVALDDEDGEVTGWIDPKKAAHIVHCVNVHEQLVAALEEAERMAEALVSMCCDAQDAEGLEEIQAALRAAKEGK